MPRRKAVTADARGTSQLGLESESPARIEHLRPRAGFAVLGAGRYGLTLAELLARRGHQVALSGDDPARLHALAQTRTDPVGLPELPYLHAGVTICADFADAVASAHTLIVAVQASQMRTLALRLGAHADPAHVVVHVVRGLEPETLERPSRLLRHQTALKKVGAMLGPALVAELLAGRPNAFVVASRFPEVGDRMIEGFASDSLRIYLSNDLVGVEIAATAASVGAVAIGIALQLGLGPATLGALIPRAAAEMARVVVAAGGKASSAWGLAGLGEMLALRESESREVVAGRALGRGEPLAQVLATLGPVHAIEAVRTFAALADRLGADAHIAQVVARILDGALPAREGVLELMRLGPMVE